uniref:RNA polymerase beta subunit n=1 Tax=Micractinium simplicissimum TaxID=2607983 RepID=UPI0023AB34CE|nr:RNA polymerase beta subunit [Micractinium simplicissimum]WCO87762.1 RNA polymerase beta subunit [Micractinium simplicissimum]
MSFNLKLLHKKNLRTKLVPNSSNLGNVQVQEKENSSSPNLCIDSSETILVTSKEFDTKKHYSNFTFSTEIPNLIDVQRKSFYSFLEHGIKTAFQDPLYFSNATHTLEIQFFPKWIQYQKPDFNQKQAFILGKTYGSSVYIPVGIKSSQSTELKVEWLLVGVLPLMTKHGHFIINGIPRVILHQMVRNPGIYMIPRDSRTQTATVRIVPEKGGWINLTVDKKNRLWFSTRSLRRKVSLLVFLQALGLSRSDLFQRLEHSEILVNSYVNELSLTKKSPDVEILLIGKTRHDKILIRAGLNGHPRTQLEAWQYLYAHFLEYSPYARDESLTEQTIRDFFWNTLWNKKTLVLGKIGRQQFREKIGSPEPLNEYSLTVEDLLGATQALLNLIYKERLGDEIDSLTQKRIRGCNEFLLEQLNRAIKEFEVFFTRKVSTLPVTKSSFPEQNPLETLWRQNKTVFSKTVSKSWKSFFTSGTLAQFMDQTNPLAEATHKRRLTVLGPGGVSSKQTTIQIRGIHPTYYGRLCPIETPEGQNAGLVNSFTVLATPSNDGLGTINTPFYQVYKGQVQKQLPPLLVSPQQEYHHIGAPADISLTQWNVLPKLSLPVRKELNFDYELSTRITTQSVGILQNISVATSLIPFLEHDDANRALMGSNMQRQAVPLIRPETPLVGTGLETRVVSDVNHVIHASHSGYISNVNSLRIKTLTPNIVNLQKCKLFDFFTNRDITKKEVSQKNNIFGNGTSSKKTVNFSNLVSGTKLSPSSSIFFSSKFSYKKKGFFGNGNKNLLNSTKIEIFGTRSQIKRLASIFEKQIDKKTENFGTNSRSKLNINSCPKSGCEIQRFEKKIGNGFTTKHKNEFRTQKIYSLTRYQRTNQSTCISERPILSETSWIEKGDIIADGAASSRGKLAIGQNVIVAYLPWEGYNFEDAILISQRLVDQDIFTSLHIDHYDIEVKNTQHGLEIITNQIPLKIDESTRDILKIEKLNSKGLVEIGSWVEEGDYLVGKISPLNPKGPSVEHQYEKLYNVIMQREKTNFRNTSLRVPKGVEGFVLDVQILPSREPDVAALAEKNSILRARVILLQRRRIQVGDKMAGRHGNKGIVSNILPCHDMPYLPDGTPVDIVLNPLGVPSRMNVGQILECLLGLAGRYLRESYTSNLFDEKFGAEASRSLVYSKLYEASIKTANSWLFEPHHPGKIKLFDGRTGIPFDQPVTVGCAYILKLVHLVDDKIHARATGPYSAVTQQPVRGRSRNGGQRLGEMEVWALQAYGAAYTLQELLTLKSDDVEGRKQAVFRIYANKALTSGRPESFKVLLRELQALCFDLQLYSNQESNEPSVPIPLTKLENLL